MTKPNLVDDLSRLPNYFWIVFFTQYGGGGVGDVGFEASTYFRCKLAYDIDGTMTRVAQLNLPDCTVRKVNLEDQSVLLGTVQADCLDVRDSAL